jgi:hypothetical protein
LHASVLSYPDFHKSFILTGDASSRAILSQMDGTKEHVIEYGERKLSKHEQSYTTTERLC